ncbi:MAG: TlpA family protein disulfide reductase, partial [Armatimonadetes bacterium]|nr:TlpA family protein disulfide reductase [Armatimonadota bacterium]
NVTKFVKEQGDKMGYTVAMDDLKGTIAETWAKAAQIPGIPSAFVIGKDGKIAAIIHPMSLDDILAKIVSGKPQTEESTEDTNKKDGK